MAKTSYHMLGKRLGKGFTSFNRSKRAKLSIIRLSKSKLSRVDACASLATMTKQLSKRATQFSRD